MAGYIGIKCISCGEKFKQGDDIVVCPDCGTPYHRDCYKKEGKCINIDLHERGGSFKTTFEAPEIDGEKIRCPRCGADNTSLTLFCEKCGMPLSMSQQSPQNGSQPDDGQQPKYFGGFSSQPFQVNFSDPLCGLNPEEEFEDAKLSELSDFVGTNTFYYLPMFKRIKETNHKLTWNFSAMIAPVTYYAYRKMYLLMILTFLFKLVIYVPTFIVMLSTVNLGDNFLTQFVQSFDLKSSSFNLVSNLTYFLSYAVMFATGAFSNWFYYRHAIHKIKKLKEAEKATSDKIKAKGGTSNLSMILVLTSPFIFGAITFVVSTIITLFS